MLNRLGVQGRLLMAFFGISAFASSSPISTGLAALGERDIDEGRYLIVHDTPSDLW